MNIHHISDLHIVYMMLGESALYFFFVAVILISVVVRSKYHDHTDSLDIS